MFSRAETLMNGPHADDLERLSQLRPALIALGCVQSLPDYKTLWTCALNGAYPAEQRNKLWYFRRRDVPAIARALGLQPGISVA
jgi:hypothetical protein